MVKYGYIIAIIYLLTIVLSYTSLLSTFQVNKEMPKS